MADVDPVFAEYEGAEPLAFVVSHNLHRRHLNESQRGMVGAKLANMNEGRPKTSAIALVTQKQAAESAYTLLKLKWALFAHFGTFWRM